MMLKTSVDAAGTILCFDDSGNLIALIVPTIPKFKSNFKSMFPDYEK